MDFSNYGFLKHGPHEADSETMCSGMPINATLAQDEQYPDSLKLTLMFHYKDESNGKCLKWGTQSGFAFSFPDNSDESFDVAKEIRNSISMKDVMDMVLDAMVRTDKAMDDDQIPIEWDWSPKSLEVLSEALLRMIKLPPSPPASLS